MKESSRYAERYLQILLKCSVNNMSSQHKKNKGTHAVLDTKLFNSSAGAGTDDICALRFAEGAKAPMDVFGSHCKMIGGARLELCQRTCHWQRKRLHLPNLLPVLLCRITARVVLMVGIEMIAVNSCTCPISFRHTPGQHYTVGTLH